jgi:hypothetical protein
MMMMMMIESVIGCPVTMKVHGQRYWHHFIHCYLPFSDICYQFLVMLCPSYTDEFKHRSWAGSDDN